jgi:hypothetical protein
MNLETFFYLRHGQSAANLAGLMCGRNCESPLTDLGPTLMVGHGGVWMAVQQILELKPSRSENAIPYKLQRKTNHWDVERFE